MFGHNPAEIVAPQQFKNEPIGGFITNHFLFIGLHFGPNFPRRKTAQRQPRRKFRCIIGPQHAVARLLINPQMIAIPNVFLKSLETGLFTTRKRNQRQGAGFRFHQPPIGQTGQLTGVQARRHRWQAIGRGQGRINGRSRFNGFPKFRKQLWNLTNFKGQIIRVIERVAPINLALNVSLNRPGRFWSFQGCFEGQFNRLFFGSHLFVIINSLCSMFRCQGR